MKCEDCEQHMADALGDELAPADRAAFESHLAECQRCRREYTTSREAIEAMRSLSGPQRVGVRREGDRLVIEDKPAALPHGARAQHGSRLAPHFAGHAFRYAATILFAFTAGYLAHAYTGLPGRTGINVFVERPIDQAKGVEEPNTLHRALRGVHERKLGRSALAKCLIAMAATNR